MATDNMTPNNSPEIIDQEFDWIDAIRKVWSIRGLLFKVAAIAMVVGIVIAFTTPKSYTVKVVLAPETTKSSSGSLASAAAMLGMSNLSLGSDNDALRATLYPDVVTSTPFMIDLLQFPVETFKEGEVMPLSEYMKEHTRKSLMGHVMSFPFMVLGKIISLFKEEEVDDPNAEINPFQLTKEQSKLVRSLSKKITATVDKKTGVTTMMVSMQDPKVAAMIAREMTEKLRNYITEYRTSKAGEDLKYWEQLYEKRRQEYYDAQKRYAEYTDANRNVVLQSVLNEKERLQNEKNLALQLYTTVATQMQMARAKVQEAKPVFAIIEPATVPLKASSTSRIIKIFEYIFLGVVGTIAWVLFGRDFVAKIREEKQ